MCKDVENLDDLSCPKASKLLENGDAEWNLYGQMSKIMKNIEFVQGVDFELIQNLPNNGTKYLLIFDDSCEEIFSSKQFEK